MIDRCSVSMESIKPLSEAVHSAVRSGFIISDLTTVVEELIYNSLDAGATKVSVYVGVSNGYVKVEDDGSGISRDGLVLLGERYATSKLHHLHAKDDDDVRSFGFRGEVLCSIADTSLIEFITKVHGRPNGYRKVMKGRKCLHRSIDGDRQDVGTTVIVRDLFYNQPVRRRQMQSSTKKVLDSVKKCAVRVALVQPRVSFKVVDMESEDELLRTHSSSSPLLVFCNNFGFEASSLHEVTLSQGSLKLKGFVSGPSSSFSLKAIQYIYVNSRFIVKGPIHKALNRLADMCWEQLSGNKGGKRGHPHTGPTYCLNLMCPRSSYDLNLEFSRTSVEFKDWDSVLSFMEKAVMAVWCKKTKEGHSYNCMTDQPRTSGKEKLAENIITAKKDWSLKTCQGPTKRRRIQNIQNEQLSAKSPLNPMEIVGNGNNLSLCRSIDRQDRNLRRNTANFGEAETDGEFPYQMDSSESRAFQSKYNTVGPSFPLVSRRSVDNGPKIDLRGCEALERNCRFSRQMGRGSTKSKRSHSAPPIYKAKKRFISIGDYLISTAESPTAQMAPWVRNVAEGGKLEHTPGLPLFYGQQQQLHEMNRADDSPFCSGQMAKETSNFMKIDDRSQDDITGTSSCSPDSLKPVQDPETSLIKWREDFPDNRLVDIANFQGVGGWSNQLKVENTILDIDSCVLHVAGDSLVPKFINRSCLERAKVLFQVDKKFIPVVAGGTLAVIDQHAADERIRLEEMRKKVLSGEMKSITYLEEEKDLVLPEMAYQLLCNYAEPVQQWGWICNIFGQDSESFNKDLNLLNGQPSHLSLLAVPCILGVNLSGADLLEFLEQLADTDGSSAIPPAILRILNYKACRGAIMFGDRLLPSECNVIVEELKQTSLCFQCAHGRPTTVPLVNLEALRRGIAQLRPWHEGSGNSWHGLCRKKISLERAKRRLDIARFGG